MIAALLAAWVQWQPQSSANASQEALCAGRAPTPTRRLAAARKRPSRAIRCRCRRCSHSSTVQQATRRAGAARATLASAVRLQPVATRETWLRLGEYDLRGDQRRKARRQRRCQRARVPPIYLNPEAIAAEAVADGDPEAIAIQNDYVEARARDQPAATARRSAPTGGARADRGR